GPRGRSARPLRRPGGERDALLAFPSPRRLRDGDDHRRRAPQPAALRPPRGRRPVARPGGGRRGDRPLARHELRGARRQRLHRPRARRSGARRLRHPRGDPVAFPGRAAEDRRPGFARGHLEPFDARRRSRPAPARALVMTGGGSGREGGRALKTRVKTARKRSLASTLWLERQLNDPYVAQARREGYRSRAAYKLIEVDDKYKLLKPGQRIVDLGAAPGGWSQVAAARVQAREGRGRVIAIDLLEMDAIDGVEFRQMDFHDPQAPARLRDWLGGPADGVLSDMAANSTGHRKTDQLRIVGLVELAADFAAEVLAPGGFFLAKVLQGGAEADLLARLKREFAAVRHVKPKASRADSAELYLLATGFRGLGERLAR